MKTKILFIVCCSLISSFAWAVGDFSGHWIGSGQVNSNIGLHSDCSSVEIIITQTADTLVTEKYISTCTQFGSTWGPVTETLKGTQVFEDGDEVGSISDDTLLTTSPSGSVAYAYNLKLIPEADGSVSLQSYYGTQNFLGAIATEAKLKKVP